MLLQAVDARPTGRPGEPREAGDQDCHARTLFPHSILVPEHYLAEYDLTRLVPNALVDSDAFSILSLRSI